MRNAEIKYLYKRFYIQNTIQIYTQKVKKKYIQKIYDLYQLLIYERTNRNELLY